jgi:glycine cleavage system regulatory protein
MKVSRRGPTAENNVIESLVLTLIGDDRPGLVEALSRVVARYGGNWEGSRMSRLGGKFAGILLVSVPGERADELTGALGQLATEGLRVVVERSVRPALSGEERLLALELIGQDRPGIVRQISEALASRGVNVEDLVTGCSSAPMSGEILFCARARLRAPATAQLDELRSALEALANDLMVDLTLAEAPREQG